MPVVCMFALILSGCEETPVKETAVTLQATDEGFLAFSGGGESDLEEVERLNHEIEHLIDEYHETLGDENRTWTVTCQVNSTDRILQGTIYITKEEISLLGISEDTRQLASFAYDTQEHHGYTAQDTLETDPLTGVELSTKVQQAFSVLEPNAELLSTEMQGFLLNDDATTQFFYMRVEEDPDTEDPDNDTYERFYLYDPVVDAMAELAWPTE